MAKLPLRFRKADMGTVELAPVLTYHRRLHYNVRRGRGLLLSGPNGVGKTWALAALTKAAINFYADKGRLFDAEFISAASMFDKIAVINDYKEPFDERRQRSWLITLINVNWLVINDLGKEYRGGQLHDQVVYKLGLVLRERSERMLTTHITTNLALSGDSSIGQIYGESIFSLLGEMVRPYVVNGVDRRRKKKK